MKALIFGGRGQDGPFLVEELRKQRVDTLHGGDVSLRGFVEDRVKSTQPDLIFQLAARSTAAHDSVFDNHAAIATGTLNVLEAALRHAPAARVMVIGSALQFENTGAPISETTPFSPTSAYAASRIAAVEMARYYRRHKGLAAYVGYLFNHESPRRKPPHVAAVIARAAKVSRLDPSTRITLRNLDTEKEWSYAGDIVRGLLRLVLQDDVHEAVIGSGLAYSIQKWCELCFGMVGGDWRQHVTSLQEPASVRLVSDPSVMVRLGWRPEKSIANLAAMMTETWEGEEG